MCLVGPFAGIAAFSPREGPRPRGSGVEAGRVPTSQVSKLRPREARCSSQAGLQATRLRAASPDPAWKPSLLLSCGMHAEVWGFFNFYFFSPYRGYVY